MTVLFTGRTMRAASNSIMDYGRPRATSAVLVDRDTANFQSALIM